MRDANVQLKPGEQKESGQLRNWTLQPAAGKCYRKEFERDYFNYFHTYELYWYPDKVRFLVDGYEQAVITKDMAKIPDKYMFLWIGSPMYQDGTYFLQSDIPFLKHDKQTIVDYIRID